MYYLECENCCAIACNVYVEGQHLCIDCADVWVEEYWQALESLGGSRFGNRWAEGLETVAYTLSLERKAEVARLDWFPEKDSNIQLTPADYAEGVIYRTYRGFGSARIFSDLTWDLLLGETGVIMSAGKGLPAYHEFNLWTCLERGKASSLEEAKKISGRKLVNLRPLVGLYLQLHPETKLLY